MIRVSLILVALLAFAQSSYAAPRPVEDVDLSRYMGRWYQIASIPAFFQRDCVSDTVAEYSLIDANTIKVVNSCRTKDGKLKQAEGRARLNPHSDHSSQLEVTFVKLFKWLWAFAGDYWVIDLGPDYEYSVVGHPDYKYGWILSRTAALNPETLREITRRLQAAGYNTCDFILSETETQKARPGTRLCDL